MGPFTSALVVIIAATGLVVIFATPWVAIYEMWKYKEEGFIVWAVVSMAIGLVYLWLLALCIYGYWP